MDETKKTFTCPKCKTDSLSYFNTSEGVILDFCGECSGIWFDKNELAHYIELSQDIPEIKEMKASARPTDLDCPKCSGKLEELPFSSKTDLLVDRCPACGGIFFDSGELMQAEKVSAELESIEQRMKLVVKRFADEGYKTL
ncbi:MAG: zf-TFIIB domain-containing protein [bacterium]|nr:zf-TFIIB domain-containing protein [bacterium]